MSADRWLVEDLSLLVGVLSLMNGPALVSGRGAGAGAVTSTVGVRSTVADLHRVLCDVLVWSRALSRVVMESASINLFGQPP